MLNLVAPGPKLIVVKTEQPQQLAQYLTAAFSCEPMEQLGLGIDITKTHCVLCLLDCTKETPQLYLYLGIAQSVEYVLCHLNNDPAKPQISSMRALPPIITFNSLGEQKPLVDKIQSEFPCERTNLNALLKRENDQGVIVAFLMDDTAAKRKFYEETLFIQQEYASLLRYLRIHAPRYLAKAFAPNAWHMVDLRIYDRYEAYDLQYQRLLTAISALQLGYVVTEAWDREVSAFTEPVGTYHIRLLTFLEPVELKQLLIGLEYSQTGQRLVDLDLFWHRKKLSWKNLLDNKEIRRQIKQTADFFPKSNFFAVQSDKLALIQHCLKQTNARLSADDKETLRQMEAVILQKAESLS